MVKRMNCLKLVNGFIKTDGWTDRRTDGLFGVKVNGFKDRHSDGCMYRWIKGWTVFHP